MNWKGCRRKRPWLNLQYYPGICLEDLRKTTTHFIQNSWSPCLDSNRVPREYKSDTSTLAQTCSIAEIEVLAAVNVENAIL
jgi:hypothetical protein